MTEPRRRPARRPALRRTRSARIVALASLLLVGTTVPFASAAEPPVDPAPAVDPAVDPNLAGGGLQPTIHYEDALAHADDEIDFEPGGRVTRGFTPRATDVQAVGGGKPRALPAGQATGADMAVSAQGTIWAGDAGEAGDGGTPVDAPVDAPAVDETALISAQTVSDTSADVSAVGLRREVFGFLPYWELADSDTRLDYNVLSTVAYFSVGADTAGNLLKKESDGSTSTGWAGWTSSRLTTVINDAHAKGTRVVLTISMFAWTSAQANRQAALLGSPTARLNLARQAAAAVRDRGADGINLDFEPIVSGYDDEFTALVRTMRQELDRLAPGYQLTFDTTGYIGNYPVEAATAPGGADAIFIMGYDYRTAGSGTTGSISPLGGPTYDLTDTVKAFAARVAPSKLILGVPYYGRAWSTDTDQPHAKNISGTKYGSSVTAIYTTALELEAEGGRRWEATEQAPWTAYRRQTCTSTYGCVNHWRQLWYDDAQSLKLRYDLALSYGLRGVGIWALGYDDGRSELNQALADKFLYSPTLARYGGADRYATAAAVSSSYAPGVPVAFVATGANFPDAVAGAAAAAKLGGPLLLVSRTAIPAATAAELGRLKPTRIVILGSAGVVSDGVAAALAPYAMGGGVSRQAGSDRYQTAAAISAATFSPGVPVAFVATGQNFPDALAGGALAGKLGGPLLLATRDGLPAATAAELGRLKPGRIVILGSAAVVGTGVEAALAGYTGGGVSRLAGTDRFATAAAVSASTYALGTNTVYVATGLDYPDALAGAALAGKVGGPLLLVTPTAIPAATAKELSRLKPANIVILGSPAAVSTSVANGLALAAVRG